jgi:gas vesicle protein
MSQQKDEKKRARAPNFSPDEKVALLNLIKQYSHIIENKKTDAVTWQDKSKALGEIIKKEIGRIQLVILQRSEQLQINMIEETERKLTIQRRREEELHQFEIRKQELDLAIMEAQLELLLEKN